MKLTYLDAKKLDQKDIEEEIYEDLEEIDCSGNRNILSNSTKSNKII